LAMSRSSLRALERRRALHLLFWNEGVRWEAGRGEEVCEVGMADLFFGGGLEDEGL